MPHKGFRKLSKGDQSIAPVPSQGSGESRGLALSQILGYTGSTCNTKHTDSFFTDSLKIMPFGGRAYNAEHEQNLDTAHSYRFQNLSKAKKLYSTHQVVLKYLITGAQTCKFDHTKLA